MTSSAASPKRVASVLVPWPRAVLCHSGESSTLASEGYGVVVLRPDQGDLRGLVALEMDAVFGGGSEGIEWLVVDGTDAFAPEPHECCQRRFSTMGDGPLRTRNVQHGNAERFRQAQRHSASNLDTQFSTATSVARCIKDVISTCAPPEARSGADEQGSVLEVLPPRSIRSTQRRRIGEERQRGGSSGPLSSHRSSYAAVGIFIGGHVDCDGHVMCAGGSRFTPTALHQAIEQGVALCRGAHSLDGVPPLIVSLGLCGQTRTWADALRQGGLAAIVVESPLWGAGVPSTVPPSRRRSFQQIFASTVPLFMEGTVSFHPNPAVLFNSPPPHDGLRERCGCRLPAAQHLMSLFPQLPEDVVPKALTSGQPPGDVASKALSSGPQAQRFPPSRCG